jgi:hypothetical protein
MRKKDSARLDVIQKGESNECCKDIGNYSIVFQEL